MNSSSPHLPIQVGSSSHRRLAEKIVSKFLFISLPGKPRLRGGALRRAGAKRPQQNY